MEWKVVAVQDAKAGIFKKPSYGVHLGEILRDWEMVVNDPQNIMNKFPEDFALYQLGVYDDVEGTFTLNKMQLSTARQVHKGTPQ